MQSIKLNDIIYFNPKVKLEKGDAYSFIPMENLTPEVKFVSDVEKKEWQGQSSSKFKDGDILFARIYPCLDNRKIAVAKTNGKGFGSTEFFVLRAKKGIADQNFVYYLSTSDLVVQTAINSYVGASGRQRADLKFIKNSQFNLPSYENQKKIAAILATYDDLIDVNKKRITILENMTEELYKEWFVRFRFPNWQNIEFEKGLPRDWKRVAIESLCREVRTPIKLKNLEENEKYIGSEHLSRRDFCIYEHSTTESVHSDKLKFKKHDILFGKIRPYLHKVCLANFDGICSTDIIVVRPIDRNALFYLLFTISSEAFIDLATVSAKGTKMPRADWGFLNRTEVSLPPKHILEKFNSTCEPIVEKIFYHLDQIDMLSKFRDGLSPRLISGKLSVDDLNIQYPPSMHASNEVEEK